MTNRYLILLLTVFNLVQYSSAQCVIDHWSLEKRLMESSLVIEGRVVAQESKWDLTHRNIYTIHTILPYRLFKGTLAGEMVKVVTMGGTVGLERHVAEPELELDPSVVGIFLLSPNTVIFNEQERLYAPTASTQSLVAYDLQAVRAYDGEHTYYSISKDLYETIEQHTGQPHRTLLDVDPEARRKGVRQTSAPIISSLDLDTVSAGTGTLLTINGSNFGLGRGTHGKVSFKDANFGDGRYYPVYLDASYVSWNNSRIQVYVPTRAGTGKVQVTNNLQESGESGKSLFIKWSHLNVTYSPSAGDTAFYPTQHINRNGQGGYTWHMTHQFASNEPAVKSIFRSLETWRCGTLMNWKVGADTSLDATASDNVNIVRFDDLSGNRLGTCWSRYSGCFNSQQNTFLWFVRELDIEFDSTYAWYYGEGNTPSGQYDFQSVATHELGHGHQLGHVRDAQKIMHYSLGPAERKDQLHAFDVEGGVYVRTKSAASGICSNPAMQALNPADCNITLPNVAFSISDTVSCQGDTVRFTSLTEGSNLSFTWHFGDSASPGTSIEAGPVGVVYTDWGTKTVKLIVENGFGKDSLERQISVLPPVPDAPVNFAEGDTNCLGVNEYTVVDVAHAENYAWAISSGGAIQGSPLGKKLKVDWTTTGTKVITSVAIGACGNSEPQRDTVYVLPYPTAGFSAVDDGLQVQFTSTGSDERTWKWYFGDGQTDSVQDPLHDFPDKGAYTVKLIVENQCGMDSATQDFALNFRAGMAELPKGWSLYPNPIGTGESIRFTRSVDGIVLMDLHGSTIWSSDIHADRYAIPELTAGTYVISVHVHGAVYRQKLFIRGE